MKLWNPSSDMTVARGCFDLRQYHRVRVFVCTGFMLGHFTPSQILWAWGLGTAIAACGMLTIASSVFAVPGGEYEYLAGQLPHRLAALIGVGTLLVCLSHRFDAVASAHFLVVKISPMVESASAVAASLSYMDSRLVGLSISGPRFRTEVCGHPHSCRWCLRPIKPRIQHAVPERKHRDTVQSLALSTVLDRLCLLGL